MIRIVAYLILAASLAAAPAAFAQAPAPDANELSRVGAEVSSLLRAYPSGGEGLANGVTNILLANASAARALAVRAKNLNCDQAAAVAIGVSRALTAAKRTDGERVKKFLDPFAQACGKCSKSDRDGRELRFKDEPRLCRMEDKVDDADPTRIRNARGEDCFCALIAGLMAQNYAQGDAGQRMGFFADELSGNGGAGGIGQWLGTNVSDN